MQHSATVHPVVLAHVTVLNESLGWDDPSGHTKAAVPLQLMSLQVGCARLQPPETHVWLLSNPQPTNNPNTTQYYTRNGKQMQQQVLSFNKQDVASKPPIFDYLASFQQTPAIRNKSNG